MTVIPTRRNPIINGILFLITRKAYDIRHKPGKAQSQLEKIDFAPIITAFMVVLSRSQSRASCLSTARIASHQWMTWERLLAWNLGPAKHSFRGLISRSQLKMLEWFERLSNTQVATAEVSCLIKKGLCTVIRPASNPFRLLKIL